MGSFAEDVYPLRYRRADFTQALIARIESQWRTVTTVGHRRDVPGDVQRCAIEGRSFRCDYAPVIMDKKRVKTLLRAWSRQISDRYLDLQYLNRLANRRHESERSAFDLIRQNAPAGAVAFVMNQIEGSRQPHFFGRELWSGWGYNEFFSALLHWDDRHCYGVVNYLRREQGRYGAGGTPGNFWAAVRTWLAENQNNGVYQEFGLRMQ